MYTYKTSFEVKKFKRCDKKLEKLNIQKANHEKKLTS